MLEFEFINVSRVFNSQTLHNGKLFFSFKLSALCTDKLKQNKNTPIN
jgi:hypothetical protein